MNGVRAMRHPLVMSTLPARVVWGTRGMGYGVVGRLVGGHRGMGPGPVKTLFPFVFKAFSGFSDIFMNFRHFPDFPTFS